MEQAEQKIVQINPDLKEKQDKFLLPEGFQVISGDENKSPFNQEFTYHGALNTHEARNALMEAGFAINAKGAGVNTGKNTYHLIEKSIYSHS